MRAILRGLSACTLAGLAAPALADDSSSNQYTLEIERQPILAALTEFSRQTGLQVGYLPANEREESAITAALNGQYTAESALQELLAPSGLAFERVNEKTIAVTAPRSKFERVALAGNAKKLSLWKRFRLAEAQAPSAVASSTASAGQAATEGSSTRQKADPLEEVIVTAQKRAERLQDVPISISVVGGEDLDSSSFTNTSDLLNTVPGVATTIGVQGGGTQVSVRGVTAANALFAGSSPIAYYVDSVPFGFVRTAIGPELAPYDLDRVEVLRGPQGTLYGASALNGVVRVLTRDARLNEFEFKARSYVSTTEEGGGNYGGDAAINVPLIEDKLAARAVVGYQDQSGWIDNLTQKDVNDAQLRNYRLKINAQPTDELSIELSGWSRRDDYGGISAADDDLQISRAKREPIAIGLDAYGLGVSYDFAEFSVESMTSYVDYSGVASMDFGSIGFAQELTSRVFSQELIINSAKDNYWHWTLGGFYRDAEDRTYQAFVLDPLARVTFCDFVDTSESVAFFGEIGARLFVDELSWTLGLRYFRDDGASQGRFLDLARYESTSEATTPRALIKWTPNSEVTIYASYSEGFRSGFAQDELVTSVAPDLPPLEPDDLKNYEIGAKGLLFGRRVSIEAAVFYIDWNEVQQTVGVAIPDSPDLIAYASVNGDSASGLGAELALTARPFDGLDMSASVSWNDLTMDAPVFSSGTRLFNKGDRLAQSPEYTAGVSAEYSFGFGSSGYTARILGAATYVSEQRTSTLGGTGVGDNMLTSRLRLAVEAPDHWTAALFVDNLNDERGTQYVTIPGLPDYNVRVRPRTVGAQVEFRF